MKFNWKSQKLTLGIALLFLCGSHAHLVAGQKGKPAQSVRTKQQRDSTLEKRLETFKQLLDKDGGYRDQVGGYYNPKAGTHTDKKGGVVDNWGGYTYKDGSKSKIGDYYDAPTRTVHLSSGEKVKLPPQNNGADAIRALKQTVTENGGYDKDFIVKGMIEQLQKEHPRTDSRNPQSVHPTQQPDSTIEKDLETFKQFLDKDGGYTDQYGGHYNPKAGTYTDKDGGGVDNFQGYTYKDGSYKSKIGEYYDAPKRTVHLNSGESFELTPDITSAVTINVLKSNVVDAGGYDKDYILKTMIIELKKEHPAVDSARPQAKVADARSAILLIDSEFPTQTGVSRLAGHSFGLTQDSFDSVLTKADVRPPAGMSPSQGWALACNNGSPTCVQGLHAMDAAPKICAVKLNGNGKGNFPAVPAGTYYLFGVTRYNNGHLIWSLKVNLKPGVNELVLKESNATQIK
ncbi:MAG: hypothetical protein ABI923_08695 [bacterium]